MNDDGSDFLTNDDLAITKPSEDLLGRTEKAHKLALNIQNYLHSKNSSAKKRKENSFVIAVLGKWGEGKTTFINFVLKNLERESKESQLTSSLCNNKILNRKCIRQECEECDTNETIKILSWDPWYSSAKSDLTYQLYKLIYPKCKLLVYETIVFYFILPLLFTLVLFGVLQRAKLIDYLPTIVTIFGIVFVVLSWLYKTYRGNKFIPKNPLSSVLNLEQLCSLFSNNPLNSFIESLRFNHDKIRAALKEITKNRKLLIVIDDVDRMKPTQIKQIFDLVKGIGNLPNVVYLIAFDKIVVSKAINPDIPTEGEKYLDKLINLQVPLYYNYRELLIKSITKELKVSERGIYIPPELGNVINNIREIKQLTSSTKAALSFIKNSIKEDSSYIAVNQKIDLQDINLSQLLCIQAILLHNKAIYDLISENKEILTVSDLKNEEAQQKLTNFKESINNLSQSYALKQLVDSLFPIERDLSYQKDIQSITELWYIAISESRKSPGSIWHPHYFEIFFTLNYPKYLVNSNQYSLLLQEDNQYKQENIYQIISDIIKQRFSKETSEKLNLDSKTDNDYRDNKYKWLTDLLEKLIKDFKNVGSYFGISTLFKKRENILNYIVVIAQAIEEDVLEHNSSINSTLEYTLIQQFKNFFNDISPKQIFTEDLKHNTELFQYIKGPRPVYAFLIYLMKDSEQLNYALKEKTNNIPKIIVEVIISNLVSVNFLLNRLSDDYFCKIIKFCTVFFINKKEDTNFILPDNFKLLIGKIKPAMQESDDLFLLFIKFSMNISTIGFSDDSKKYKDITPYSEHYVDLQDAIKRLTSMQGNPKYSDDDNKKLIDASIKEINNYLKNKNKAPIFIG